MREMVWGVGDGLGEFEQAVLLGLLQAGNGAYGAVIRREIEQRTGRRLAESAVYVTLKRLEGKGFVCSYVGDPMQVRGGRRRKHYLVLEPGLRAIALAYRNFTRLADGVRLQLEAVRLPAR